MGNVSLVVMNKRDNVATAVMDLESGLKAGTGDGREINVKESIPFGHKLALQNIFSGQVVIKYGEPIGIATKDIKTGQHVHVHNVEGNRGRGDKKGDN